MKTDNELIAEFMGFKKNGKQHTSGGIIMHQYFCEGYGNVYPTEFVAFEVKWDWLMPVVEKISRHVYDEHDGIKNQAYLRTFGMIDDSGKFMVRFNGSPLFSSNSLIGATYVAVVDWIKWYNENKQ